MASCNFSLIFVNMIGIFALRRIKSWGFPGGSGLRLCTPNTEGLGLIPGQRTRSQSLN